jgi:hypothetical protein
MSEEDTKTKSLVPHFTIAGVLIALLAAYFLWPNTVVEVPPQQAPAPVIVPEPVPEPELIAEPVELEEDVVPEPEPIPEPEPLDTSDSAVKTELLNLTDYDALAKLLVNEGLLQRFVIMTNNLANKSLAANHQVLVPPEQPFRTFVQADKEWIDPASYKRYTPYVDVLGSLDASSIHQLYTQYKPAIDNIFAEISGPRDDFDEKLIDAIDLLLDTPEVPVPVEVYTDSVMYKFKDRNLESLAPPQKQLLRTGPENMRRIKAKLREIKQILEEK